MPPACPVEVLYVLSYRSEERNDPPGKPVAFRADFEAVRCSEERNDPPGKPVALCACEWIESAR